MSLFLAPNKATKTWWQQTLRTLKGLHGNCQLFNIGCTKFYFCYTLYYSKVLAIQKRKPEKKSVTNLHWTWTQAARLWEFMFFGGGGVKKTLIIPWVSEKLKYFLLKKKASGKPMGKALQQYFQVYRFTPNNTPSSLTPAKVMFACKIRSVFSKQLPKQTKLAWTSTVPKKCYQPGEKVCFQIFHDNKSFWEMDTIEKRVGNMIYIIRGPQFTHKTHLNQIRKRLFDDADIGPPEEKEVMDVIYDTFDMQILQVAPEQCRLKRKRKMTRLYCH